MARGQKKIKYELASQDEANEMIQNGSAEIPAESILKKEIAIDNNDYNNHPKFDKFKTQGVKNNDK